MKRRILAWIMTFMIVFGTMPANVWQVSAAETNIKASNPEQIGNYFEVNDTTGGLPNSPGLSTSTVQSYESGQVKVEKTISATGTENVFDVTLKVTTSEYIEQETISPDAATVLVIDCSGSMDERLDVAKEAAQTFINSYAAENANRKIAIVKFCGSKNSDIDGATTVQKWTDASDIQTTSNTNYCSALRNLSDLGGTNIEAGMILAKNLISSSEVADIENKNIILLSDGAPSYGVSGNEVNSTSTEVICADGTNMEGPGNTDNGIECCVHEPVEELVPQIQAMGVKTYAVFVGNERETLRCDDCNRIDGDTVKEWLADDCGYTTYSTSDDEIDKLINIFESILNLIELKANAWMVTDPMGSKIDFVKFNRDAQPVNEFTETDGTISWDIKTSIVPEPNTEVIDGKTINTYTYELPYRIKLDTLENGYTKDTLYNTNETTGSTYMIESSATGQESTYTIGTAYFNIPSVKGYAARLPFERVKYGQISEDGSEIEPLAGATFKIVHSDDCTCGTVNTEWNMTVTSDDTGSFTFNDIPSGHKYVMTESAAPVGYKVSSGSYSFTVSYGTVIDSVNNGLFNDDGIIINNKIPLTNVTGTKSWINDGDGSARPDTVTVELLANGTVVDSQEISAANNWAYSFENLPAKDDAGNEITYTVNEVAVPDYKTIINGNDITNIYSKADTEYIVAKVWENNSQPEDIPHDLVLELYKSVNDSEWNKVTDAQGSWVSTDGNVWVYKFTGLEKFTADGELIQYKAYETHVPAGYEPQGEPQVTPATGSITTTDQKVIKVVSGLSDANTTTRNTETSSFNVGNNEVGIVIGDVSDSNSYNIWTSRLLNDEEKELVIQFAKTKYSSLNEDNCTFDTGNKTYSNGKNTTNYKASAAVEYVNSKVTLEISKGRNASHIWTSRYQGTFKFADEQITNETYVAGSTTLTNAPAEKTVASVKKVWDDADNQDGLRPESLTVTLSNGEAATLNEANGWTATIEDLPKYKDGELIEYTWSENLLPGYELTNTSKEGTLTVLTNTHVPEVTEATVEKVWDDADNQDGKRPSSLDVILSNGTTITLNENNDWSATVDNLPKYSNGAEIEYTWTEITVDGYEQTGNYTEGTVTTITNSYTPEVIDIPVTKVWNDNNNDAGKRPASVQVQLYANGTEQGTPVTLNADNEWSHTWTGVDKYSDGNLIDYTVRETNTAELSANNYSWNVVKNDDGTYVVTNTHPAVRDISVTKVWDDADNQDGMRPDFIDVKLTGTIDKDGEAEVVVEKTATIKADEKGNWTYEWENLYVNYVENDVLYPIVYEVTENKVDGYEAPVVVGDMESGFVITNTHTPAVTEATVTKIWDDADNQDGIRPEELTVTLSNGSAVTLNEDNEWTATVTGLPKYADGEEITYTWTEPEVEGYDLTETSAEGTVTTLTNTHEPEETEATVKKVWDDADNQDGKRPEELTVTLSNGSAVTLNEDNEWTATVTGLPKYADGEEIAYTWTEAEVGGYELTDTSATGTVTTLTNTHEPGKTNIEGQKIWEDNSDKFGNRPESITIELIAKVDGEKVDALSQSKTVSESDRWLYKFEDVPTHHQGKEIEYSIKEVAVDRYNTSYDGYNVINTLKQISVHGTKIWDDNNDQDGLRPQSVTIRLTAGVAGENGEMVAVDELAMSQTVTAATSWKWGFKNLPKYVNGQEVEYTVTEDVVTGYTSEIVNDKGNQYTVTNTHTPEKIVVSGTKTWNDANNQDGKRPASIKINLLANGNMIDSQILTAGDDGKWQADELTYTFDNLDRYKDGAEVKYSITEDAVENYTTTYNGYNVTNSYTPGKTSVSVSKVWNDNNNQDGKRPADITVKLIANGVETDETLVLSDGNNWTGTFTALDEYANGAKIAYTVKEVSVTDYATVITGDAVIGFTITNSHTPEVKMITGTKSWDDNNDQDGRRPDSINVILVADGANLKTQTVTAEDGWTWKFENLPVYKAGVLINYTVKEVPVNEYTSAETENSGILNIHNPEKTNVEVFKSWQDDSNRDGIQPASVSIKLLATVDNGDGTSTTKVINNGEELNAGNNWHHNFADLPKYEKGKLIKYSVEEKSVPDGYTVEITETLPNTFTVINTHKPETVDISGSKTWNDANNQDGERPETLTVNLYADGALKAVKEVTAADGWAWEFKDLPKYQKGKVGQLIQYTVTETAIDGYATTYSTSGDKLTQDITNKHDPDKTSITVSKVWKDSDDQDGIRPDDVTVELLADGVGTGKTLVLKAKDNWTGTFTDLDVNKDAKEIVYTIKENKVEGYNTIITGTAADGFVVTNSHTPETTSISGYKVWDDNNNNDGKRPESIIINVWNGDKEVASTTVTPDAAGNWIWEFKDLPKYQNHGQQIDYRFVEDKVAGYETVVEGDKITNIHEDETIVIKGEKSWNDANDQDGLRPNEVTVQIMDGDTVADLVTVKALDGWKYESKALPKYRDGVEITYTVKEVPVTGYEAAIDGYNVTNTHAPATVDIEGAKTWNDADDQDGKRPESVTVKLFADGTEIDSKTVTAADGWKYAFSNLPKFKAGTEIVYTIEEVAVTGYTTTYDGYNITNSYTPGKTSVTVNKVWVDGNNQDGIRPARVHALLYADGQVIDRAELMESNGWTHTWTGLDEMKAGEKITYTVKEAMPGNTEDYYTSSIEGFTITNTHTPETTNITGTKTWNDGNDQDGIRPDSIQVQIMSNIGGTELAVDTVTVTPDADGNWTYTSKDLPKYADGKEIIYTVREIPVDGYTSIVSGTDIVNTHEPAVIDISGEKEWLDADDQDGKRPESITVNLLADGVKVDSMTVDADDSWAWTFKDMPKYKDGAEIVYTVTEDKADDYSTTIDEFDITNEYTPGKTGVSVAKAWDDAGNQDGIRPNAVFVQLYADGVKVDGAVKELNDSNNWAASFTDLDEYKDGELINYTVAEVDVADGYTADIAETENGFVITNSHKPATTEVKGTKTWNDDGDQDGKRPESLALTLNADGVPVDTQTITAKDGWKWSFRDLPKYKDGKLITYTVTEVLPEGYSEADTAEGITNSYTPEQTSVKVTKFWDDADNQDGIRPDGAAMVLLADGISTGKLVLLNADNNWTAVVDGLDKYKDGYAIQYSFEELAVECYTYTIKGNMADGFTVVNTHVPEHILVDGVKTWDDADDQAGFRPESIVINLLADGKKIDSTVVTAENGWKWNFGKQPKYADGKEIIYTVVEEQISNYDTTLNNVKHDVTNTHVPSKTTVTVVKKWNDSNDQDGIRPDSITVYLQANGEDTGLTMKLNESNKWVGTFNDLPEYADGKKIKYTVTENVIEGYTTVITGKDTKYITITNTHEPEVITVAGTKTWNDNDDQNGKRPESIRVNLLADGAVVDYATVTAEDNWTYEFADIAKFKAGKEIAYTVEETPVAGYVSEINGYDVINTLKDESAVIISGTKVLENAELTAGQFEFGLYSEAGELIGTAVNGADGTIGFEEIKYSEEGTFVYFIKEMIPADAMELEPGVFVHDGIVYDTAEYRYTVEVTEDDSSYTAVSAVAKLAEDGSWAECETIEFTNEYIAGEEEDGGSNDNSEEQGDDPTTPDDPEDKPDVVPPGADEEADEDPLTEEDRDGSAQTGDTFNLYLWMMIALAGVFGAAGAVTFRRREN